MKRFFEDYKFAELSTLFYLAVSCMFNATETRVNPVPVICQISKLSMRPLSMAQWQCK